MPESKLKVKSSKLKVEKTTTKKTVAKAAKTVGLTVPVFSLDGKEAGTMEMPKEIFGAKVNKPLLSQALRVYTNNTKGHFSSTKTRGEVQGSTKKIRAQKGTGGARHGSIRASIFVGGGIALGPKPRKAGLELPKRMKKAALLSALSAKMNEGQVLGLSGVEKASGKTAQVRNFFNVLAKKNILVVVDSKNENFSRAARNLAQVNVLTFDQLNVLEATAYQALVFTKEAVGKLESRIKTEEDKSKVKG